MVKDGSLYRDKPRFLYPSVSLYFTDIYGCLHQHPYRTRAPHDPRAPPSFCLHGSPRESVYVKSAVDQSELAPGDRNSCSIGESGASFSDQTELSRFRGDCCSFSHFFKAPLVSVRMKQSSSVPAFLTKLWTLVEDADTNEFICWSQVRAQMLTGGS